MDFADPARLPSAGRVTSNKQRAASLKQRGAFIEQRATSIE
ncbi:MAG TPA: hypothetical protein VG345_13465 [Bryobacteraceae bacterium]|jgi:hypothetical protein|nr:hypothetical protein [Bryobacteraceae bacterium]